MLDGIGKIGWILPGVVGNSHASSVIQRATAGHDFFAEDDVVRLEVDTVEATEAAAVVSV